MCHRMNTAAAMKKVFRSVVHFHEVIQSFHDLNSIHISDCMRTAH